MLGLLIGAALMGAAEDDNYDRQDYDSTAEWLKPCTDEWRNSHPFGYNQYTNGWDEDDDEENGW